jgi:hypothetical protein
MLVRIQGKRTLNTVVGNVNYWSHVEISITFLQKAKIELPYDLFFFLLLFICAYKAWFISPPCPHSPLTTHSAPSLSLPLNTQQKLFCPYF